MNAIFQKLKNYLIPHEGNDHRPQLLRPQAVIFVCLVALILEGTFLFGSAYVVPRSRLFGTILVNALVDGTNQARLGASLPTLHESALLDAAAQEKANDMVKNGYFAHTSPAGVTPWYWFQNVGYQYVAAGENLAVDFTDSADVTNAWLNSPEHRANIMDTGYTEIGMAIAQGQFEGHPATFVVELFGTPVPTFSFAPVASAAQTPSAPAPVVKPKSKPKAPVVVPVIMSSGTAATNATSEPIAVAIKGAQTGTVPAAAPAPAAASAAPQAAAMQNNFVQTAAADPRRTLDYVYFAIAVLFAVALILNIFIKIHIQHPQVILGGMLVILIAGLFIVLNQHFGGAGVIIL